MMKTSAYRVLCSLFLLALTFLTQPLCAQVPPSTWEKLREESEGGVSDDIAIADGKLFMAHYNELFMSADDGLTWAYVLTKGNLNIAYGGSPNTLAGSDRKILVCGDTVLFGNQFSPDGGDTWQTWNVDASTLPTSYYFHPTVMHVSGPNLYLGTLIQGMYQSADMGKTFTPMHAGYPRDAHGHYYQPAMTIEFLDGRPVISTISGLYRWNGSAWTHPEGNGLPATILNPETAYPTTSYLIDRIRFLGDMWLVSTNFGIYYSNDEGTNWTRFTAIPQLFYPGDWSGYSAAPLFYNLDVADGVIMVSYDNDVYVSEDNGVSWQHAQLPDRVESKRMIRRGEDLLVATVGGGIYRSSDHGRTWRGSNTGFERVTFVVFENKDDGFIGSSKKILKTSQRGKVLTPFDNGIDLTRYFGITAISSDEIFATQFRHYSWGGMTAQLHYQSYQTAMSTADWNESDNIPVDYIFKMQVSPGGDYLVTGPIAMPGGSQHLKGMYLSEDKGETWRNIFTNVTNKNTSSDDIVSCMLFDSDTIYAGASFSGIYKSSDKGVTWSPISNGLNIPDLDGDWWADTTTLDHISLIKRFENHLYAIGENTFFGYGALHHSSDGGNHWVKKGFSSLGPEYATAIITSLSITETGSLVARVARDYYKVFTLLISHDHGDTWTQCGPDFPDGEYINTVGLLGDYLYAGGKTGLWRLKLSERLTVYATTQIGDKGTQVTVPIRTDHLANVIGSQFSLTWNSSVGEFAGIEQFNLPGLDSSSFGMNRVSEGKMTFSWSSPDLHPQNLPDSSVLFAVRFNLVGDYGDSTPVKIENTPVAVEFIDDQFEPMSWATYPGELRIRESAIVQGTVSYNNGEPARNVTLHLANLTTSLSEAVTTDGNGNFAFDVMLKGNDNASFILAPSKPEEPDPLNGIDAADIAGIRRHILGTESLADPYRVIAADVNQSESVTTLDIILIQALILGVKDNFPGNAHWSFVKSHDGFKDPDHPFPFDQFATVSAADPESFQVDFIAVKLGDVNESRDHNDERIRVAPEVVFVLENPNEAGKDIVEIPVSVRHFDRISAYQFTVTWNHETLEYIRTIHVSTRAQIGDQRTNEGVLTTVWDDDKGGSVTLDDNSELFRLQFRKKNPSLDHTNVDINGALTKASVYNAQLKQVPHSVEHTMPMEYPSTFRVYQNFPNAFHKFTSIRFELPQPGYIQIDVVDIRGTVIKRWGSSYEAGTHVIDWDGTDDGGNNVKPGAYIYKATYGNISQVMRMVKY